MVVVVRGMLGGEEARRLGFIIRGFAPLGE